VTTKLTTTRSTINGNYNPKRGRKPFWPYPNVTKMSAHPTGRWVKKIRGVLRYFGSWRDPKAARDKYLAIGPYLHRGESPPDGSGDPATLTAGELFAKFLDHKNQLIETADGPSGHTVAGYAAVCKLALKQLGKHKAAASLRPDDFGRLRRSFATQYGAHRLNNSITVVRSAFRWAHDNGVLAESPKFGTMFRKASRSSIRSARAKKAQRKFTASELRQAVDTASSPLKAMILLGINGGFESAQFGTLSLADVDLDAGVINLVRNKTKVTRVVTLWAETVAALVEALRHRPAPVTEKHKSLFFITRWGNPYWGTNVVREDGLAKRASRTDAIAQEFRKVLKKLKIIRAGVGFGSLRHTFRTVADECRDTNAICRVMGHVLRGLDDSYVTEIGVDRIRVVTDHVRQWYLTAK